MGINVYEPVSKTFGFFSTGLGAGWHYTTVEMPSKMSGWWDRLIKTGTGQTGKTPTGTGEGDRGVGVWIKSFKPVGEFKEGMPISWSAEIEGSALKDLEIPVHMECTANEHQGEIYPSPDIILTEDDNVRLMDCTFENIPAGRYSFKYTNLFEFATVADLKIVFVSEELKKAFTNQEKELMQLTEDEKIVRTAFLAKQKAIFNQGPVNVGMEVDNPRSQLIGLPYGSKKMSWKLSINNRWGGKIKELKALAFMVPEGFTVSKVNGVAVQTAQCNVLPAEEVASCEETNKKVYIAPRSIIETVKDEILSATFNINLEANTPEVLTGLSVEKHLKAMAAYDYYNEKSMYREVQEAT
jgi:hypothetical protein